MDLLGFRLSVLAVIELLTQETFHDGSEIVGDHDLQAVAHVLVSALKSINDR